MKTWVALPAGIPTSAPTKVPNAPAIWPPSVAAIMTASSTTILLMRTVRDITMGFSTWFSTCQ